MRLQVCNIFENKSIYSNSFDQENKNFQIIIIKYMVYQSILKINKCISHHSLIEIKERLISITASSKSRQLNYNDNIHCQKIVSQY